MSYCNIEDLKRILPEKVTIGDQNIGTPTPGRTSTKRSNITPDEARYYIEYGQQYVDARLRPFYVCPLRRVKSYEVELDVIVMSGVNVTVTVRDSGAFGIGQLVRLQDKSGYENSEIVSVESLTSFTVALVSRIYTPDDTKVSILEFPDPIPLMTARFASSFLLDRLYTSEQSPDVSNYGKTQRNIARDSMDDILAGEILLFGQEHTGRRFIRGSLLDAYKSPAEVQKGQEKE